MGDSGRPVAIVTAASRGIGAACARRLSKDGVRVALMARSASVVDLARSLGGIGVQGSVGEADDLQRLVDVTLARFGQIDAVVNNTGNPSQGALLDITDDVWHADLDLILLNVVRLSRLVTPVMLARGGGSIVNISAADAYEPALQFPVGSTLRAALGAWTKLYADRYAAEGIRMNSVLPGIVLPDGSTHAADDIRDRVPTQRAGRYDEIADVVAFLLSDRASYLTGQNLRVDGGLARSV